MPRNGAIIFGDLIGKLDVLHVPLREDGGKAVSQKKTTSSYVRPTTTEPITCPYCGGQAYLMRRTLHPKIKGEIWTFECKNCGKQTEKSVLH
jgi:transcription elongation factor Elf1